MNAKTQLTPWKIDEANDLPLAIIEDTEDGFGVIELGARTHENIAFAHAVVRDHNAVLNLLATLENLQREIRAHIRMDVKQHYSLMVADAAATKAIADARGQIGFDDTSHSEEIDANDWVEACEYFGLDDSFQYSEEQQRDYIHAMRSGA